MKLLLTIFFFAALTMSAADYCVGPSATGTGSGADWNNLKAWSATPSRGDVWYLADGTYAAKDLDVAASGSTIITIKKATSGSHATATGWSSTMGDGQAIINSLDIQTSYWIIDGVTGDGFSTLPADITTTNYGIHFSKIWQCITLADGANHVTVKHCYFLTTEYGQGAIYNTDSTYGNYTDLTVSYCLFDGWNECINNYRCQLTRLVFEYNVILNSEGHNYEDATPDTHGNSINALWADIVDSTIRYCLWKDYIGNGISGIISANDSDITGMKVYGCVFDNIWPTTYIFGANSGFSVDNNTFHHNTVIHCAEAESYPILGRNTGSGNTARNNIYYNLISTAPIGSAWGDDYSAWFSCAASSGANKTTGSGSPFVNYAAGDYRLATNTTAGTSLASDYTVDALGNTRTSLTRGAFEYDGSPGVRPTITSGNASGTNGVVFDYTSTATESPTGWGATNLPTGLYITNATGRIGGMPTVAITNNVGLFATNATGWTNAVVVFSIAQTNAAPAPASGLRLIITTSMNVFGNATIP